MMRGRARSRLLQRVTRRGNASMCYALRLCLVIAYVALSAVVVLGQRWPVARDENLRRITVSNDDGDVYVESSGDGSEIVLKTAKVRVTDGDVYCGTSNVGLSESIDTLKAKDDAVDVRMDTLNDTQADLRNDFDALETTTSGRLTSIDTTLSALASKDTSLTSVDANLSSRIDELNATDVQLKATDETLKTHISSLNATDAELKGVDDGLSSRIDALRDIYVNELNVTDKQLIVTDAKLGSRIDSLNATQYELKGVDAGLSSRIDALDAAKTALQQVDANVTALISSLNATDVELKTRDTELAGRIDALNTTDAELKTRLASLNSRLQSAEDEISTIKTEITSLLSAETDPQVGTVTQDKWCVGTSSGQVECNQEPPVSAFPSCSNDGLLTYNGTQYACWCINGFSGSLCEIPKSLSGLETLEMSKVNNAQAVGDSSTNPFSNIIDGDVSTRWYSGGDADEYVEFDLQAAIKTVGLAVALPSVSYNRGLPKDMKLEVSNTGHTGPWVTAREFQLVGTDRWQFFDLPTFATGYRYYRLYVVNSYVSGRNAMISEVEFFQNNTGIRIGPAVDRQNLPPGSLAGVSATNECARDSSIRQTYGCSRLSIWPVVAKNSDAWGCESGSVQHTSYYGHHANAVCKCADGWQGVHIPSGTSFGYATVLTCIRL